ncbi:MAG: hypothetical protein V1808_02365 [Candidatus Daviesbacteria bacterium]
MKEKGFVPILIIVGVVLVTIIAGGTYYFTTADNNKSKQESAVKNEAVNKTGVEITPSNQLRVSVAPTLTPTLTLAPTKKVTLTLVPTHTVTPTVVPTHTITPIPTPICNINTGSTNTTVTSSFSGAVLSLSPANGAYKKGENLAVQINIDPKGRNIDAIDALLQFDPAKLAVISIIGKVGSYNQFTFPSSTFNNSNGRIYLSLIDMGYTGMFNSNVTFAVINFKISSSASGNIEVKFDFDPNNPSNTTDSNIVERNNVTDALGSVTNGFYTIKPDGCN